MIRFPFQIIVAGLLWFMVMGSTIGSLAEGALDCSGAVEISLGDVIAGDTTGGLNIVSSYSCGSWDLSGPEVVFHLNVPEPAMWTAELVPTSGAELDLVLLNQCDEVAGCQIMVDSSVSSAANSMGDFYLVVDGRDGAAGTFELRITTQDPPVSPCGNSQQAFVGDSGETISTGSYDISGDTCDSTNQIDELGCVSYSLLGKDEFFELVLLPNAMVNITITSTADAALWLLDTCEDFIDANCLAQADNTYAGQPETLSWFNDTGSQAQLWLVIDSWGTDTCGSFQGTIELMYEGAVPIESTTWGGLRAIYR